MSSPSFSPPQALPWAPRVHVDVVVPQAHSVHTCPHPVLAEGEQWVAGQAGNSCRPRRSLLLPWQVHNVAFAFELMLDGGLKKPKARPEGSDLPGGPRGQ